jgi:AcrR family transcriptional regulator
MAERQDPIQAQLATARRNQILDAATQVFAERGFHNTTIRQIAQQAGIADGTVYIYFKTKTDLLLGILNRINESERRQEDLGQAVLSDFANFALFYLRQRMATLETSFQALRAILPDILSNAELRSHYYTQVVEPTFVLAEPVFRTWIAQGLIKPLEPALVTRLFSSAVLGLLVLRMLGDPVAENEWNRFPEVMMELLLHGLVLKGEQQ